MDWQTAQNWLVFLPVVGLLGYYYIPAGTFTQERNPDQGRRGSLASNKKRDDEDTRTKTKERKPAQQENVTPPASTENTKKRKAGKREQTAPAKVTPSVVVQNDEPEEIDMSTKQFAMQMAQARKGHQIGSSKEKRDRVKTVKQGSVLGTPNLSSGSSQAGADADDDMSPVPSPALHGGDVSDMLEPTPKGPSTLRLTASSQPQREKKVREAKEETALTKKQRQNRKRVEEQREQRAEEEKSRKALEEQQRRSARIARGEPAKNGIPISKPPTNNAWTAPKPAVADDSAIAPTSNGNNSAPLLDTFDAESTGSSAGGMEASTAATSTTEAGPTQNDHEMLSEEDQVAIAMKQSTNESGWTEVAAPKKGKKNTINDEASGNTTPKKPLSNGRATASTAKSSNAGKLSGFQALNDHYEQRADVDPNDASSWDA